MSAIGAGAGASAATAVVQNNISTKDIGSLFAKYGPICDSEGFYQHYGECWSDAFQMMMLYQDGIKELTQSQLASERIEKEKIYQNFEALVYQTGSNLKVNKAEQFYDLNLKSIYLYFKAVQERFHRHYRAELSRYLQLGPMKCGEYDKIGGEALKALRDISKQYRSKDTNKFEKPGVQAAIMSQKRAHFYTKDRESLILSNYVKQGRATGGTIEDENYYLVQLYNIFFGLDLRSFTYNIKNFTAKNFERQVLPLCFYNQVKVLRTPEENNILSRHATSFYTCGQKDYYFDNENGNLLFPWKNFLYKYLELTETKECQIVFSGEFIIEKKDEFLKLVKYKNYPYIRYKENSIKKFITFIEGIDEPIEMDLSIAKQSNIFQVTKNNIRFTLSINLIEEQLYILEALFGIQNSMDVPVFNQKLNKETGLYQSARLQKNNIDSPSLLGTAIDNRDRDKIIYAINVKKEDVYQTGKNLNTALHIAVIMNDFELVKYLVENTKIDINLLNGSRMSPLMIAISEKHMDIANYLLDKGADQFIQSTIIMAKPIIILELALKVSDSLFKTNDVEFKKSLELLQKLIDQNKAKGLNYKQYFSKPLTDIIRHNNIELLNLLVKNGLEFNKLKFSPLIVAIGDEHLEILEYLLNNGASIAKTEEIMQSKIIYHLIQSWIDDWTKSNPTFPKALDLLIKHGADVKGLTSKGNTFLWEAIKNPIAFDLLLHTYKLDPKFKNKDNKTIIMHLIQNTILHYLLKIEIPLEKMITDLIELGVDINAQDDLGMTALMYAIEDDYYPESLKKIKILCKFKPNTELKNNNNFTVFDLLKRKVDYHLRYLGDTTFDEEEQNLRKALEECKTKQNNSKNKNQNIKNNKNNQNKNSATRKNTKQNIAKGAGENTSKRKRKTRRS